jgi:pilus assembly protein CpaE
MKRLLIIDDEKIYQKMIAHAVQSLDLEIDVADDGEQGLEMANQNPPDLIISDVLMPNVDGFQVTRKLRRDPRFAHTPIMILTAQSELSDKLEAFEAGADDHMTKPFESIELVARLNVLLRRSESVEIEKPAQPDQKVQKARLIAVHCLRGGSGCSSMAINLGISLYHQKPVPTLLLDLVLTAGQIALMINASLKRTWADIARISPEELDWDALQSIIGRHESGVHFIAAPTYPSEAELLTPDLVIKAISILSSKFRNIVVDLPHDFSGMTLDILDSADRIVVLFAPELASIRAAAVALDTYQKLNYPPEKIKFVMNNLFEQRGIPGKKIELVLKRAIEMTIPFAPELFVEAINVGRPLLFAKPKENISLAIASFAQKI